jgi:hypothetical protein
MCWRNGGFGPGISQYHACPEPFGGISCEIRPRRCNSIRSIAPFSRLQRDGRLSNVELAQRVHLSPSACLRRVKQLEESGVIAQYVALLNPKAVGRHGTSFTIINLESMNNRSSKPSSRRCAMRPRSWTASTWPAPTTTCCACLPRCRGPGALPHRGADAPARRGALELDAGAAHGEEDHRAGVVGRQGARQAPRAMQPHR